MFARTISRTILFRLSCGVVLFGFWAFGAVDTALAQTPALGQTIEVPLDYTDPKLGLAPLYFEFGAPYEKSKPLILVIADGQQFYVRRGATAGLQRTFGPGFNVVGIVGRGATPEFVRSAQDTGGKPDWVKAWRIFNSNQWVEDIESVRKTIVGSDGQVLIFGSSGGGWLAHQYLLKYGAKVARAFTVTPGNPFTPRELRVGFEHFWDELGAYDKSLQPLLKKVLADHAAERAAIIFTLQRQHFFVTDDKLPTARADLIRAVASGDLKRLEEARKDYQVDATMKFLDSLEGVPIRVREFELIYPTGDLEKLKGDGVYPGVETEYLFAKPFVELLDSGKISAPSFDLSSAHRLGTDVFILASRWDEAEDYRGLIAVAYSFPRHELFLADDNHVLTKLGKSGLYTRLIQTFLKFGLDSDELRNVLKAAEEYRWKER